MFFFPTFLGLGLWVRGILAEEMAAIAALVLALAAAPAALAAAAPPPNLVLILTDDMGFHSPGFINNLTLTPSIDELARQGVFANMYSYKFCSPTRAAFLTGRFPWRASSTLCPGPVCNYLPAHIPMGIHTGYSMLPKRLQEAGYISYHSGKWHEVSLGVGRAPPLGAPAP